MLKPAFIHPPPKFSLSNHHLQLSWPRLALLNVTFPELQSVVETNAKQRFALIPASDLATTPNHAPPHDPLNPAHYRIRATQGHSLPIASENLLTPIQLTDPDCPDQVVHGTYDSKWKLILKSGGLRPMGRQHVHFALGLPSKGGAAHSQLGADTLPSSSSSAAIGLRPTPKEDENSVEQTADPTSTADETIIAPAPMLSPSTQPLASATQNPDPQPIISGMRATASVLIWVDLKRSLKAGALTWWRSANGVVLTEGDAERKVGLEWIERVERRGGGLIWEGSSRKD